MQLTAQQKFIQGRVVDKKSKSGLAATNVFISNSTFGTTSDLEGFFSLPLPASGEFTIVVSFVGYKSVSISSANLPASFQLLQVELEEEAAMLEAIHVEAKRDTEWQENFKRFRDTFLGEEVPPDVAEIENPEVIDFEKTKKMLRAFAREPIIITNQKLGYKMLYHLQNFQLTKDSYRIIGNTFFQDIPETSARRKRDLSLARSNAFRGSFPHFVQTCINQNFQDAGYLLFAVERLPGEPQERLLPIDSISVVRTERGTFILELPETLEIRYTRYSQSTSKRQRANHIGAITRLKTSGKLPVSEDGFALSDSDFELAGSMAAKRIATILPRDFSDTLTFNEIRGVLRDVSSGEPLMDGIIFLNHSTYQALTDEEGRFVLRGMEVGYYDLIAYAKGYRPLVSKIKILDDRTFALQLALEKEGVPNRKSRRLEHRIKQVFNQIGQDSSLRVEKIDQVTRIHSKDERCRGLVYLINGHTNYRITCLYDEGGMNDRARSYFVFNEMPAVSPDKRITQELARSNAYFGSPHHLLQSIVSTSSQAEGFFLYKSDSTMFLPRVRSSNGIFSISLPQNIFVRYRALPSIQAFVDDIPTWQYVLSFKDSLIATDQNGVPLDPDRMIAEAEDETRFSIPRNYYPLDSKARWNNLVNLMEVFTISTDRPYYYPGDRLYFSALAGYANPSLADSLSRVLHVELLSKNHKRIQKLSLKIERGFAYGVIELPLSLESGMFTLAANTTWMQNFGYAPAMQGIQILPRGTNLSEGVAERNLRSSLFSSTTAKKQFGRREKIELSLSLLDTTRTLALSVSVTDATIVKDVPIKNPNPAFVWPDQPIYLDKIRFPLERTITAEGQIQAEEMPAIVRLIDPAAAFVRDLPVDRKGFFKLSAYDFYDSVQFFVEATKRLRKVKIDHIKWRTTRVVANPSTLADQFVPQPYSYNSVVLSRTFNVPTDSARILQEVVIQAPKIKPEDTKRFQINRSDFVLSGDAVNRPGYLVQNIAGKVPGVFVNCPAPPLNCQIRFGRAFGSTIMGNSDPLVLLNDSPVPLSILMDINPAMVDRIEFTRRINVLYGDQGAKGIIAIYTKRNSENKSTSEAESNFTYRTWVKGYSPGRAFSGPNYGTPKNTNQLDDRVLLFWKPNVLLNKSENDQKLTFYSGDIPGRYRIHIRGIDNTGQPAESSFLIEVR